MNEFYYLFQIRHAKIAHPTSGETVPSLIGAASESVRCEKVEIDRNNRAK